MTVTSRARGFTLIELMVTLAVVAIVAAIAAPSFSDMLRQHRLTTQANNFLGILQLARSEAVNRGVNVTIQRCGNTDSVWDQGWQIFTDWNEDGLFNTSSGATDYCSNPSSNNIPTDCSLERDCLLSGYPALSNGLTLRTGGAYTKRVSFSATGSTASSFNDTFRLCDPQATNDVEFSRAIVINALGRPRVSEQAESCP